MEITRSVRESVRTRNITQIDFQVGCVSTVETDLKSQRLKDSVTTVTE